MRCSEPGLRAPVAIPAFLRSWPAPRSPAGSWGDEPTQILFDGAGDGGKSVGIMQNIIRSMIGGCCLGLLVLPQVGRGQNFYVGADAGVAIAEDVKLKQFILPTPGAKLKLYDGGRLSVAGGYNFNDYLGAQLESGCIINGVRSVSGGRDFDATVSHVPLLADFVVRYDKPDFDFVPFAGIGAGGDVSVIDVDHERAANGTRVDGSGGDVVFAWQAFAGLRYKVTDHISVGGAYKFFAADGATWDVERSRGDIKSGSALVHSLVVDFTWRF